MSKIQEEFEDLPDFLQDRDGEQTFYTTNFNGSATKRSNVLCSRDLWVVSVRVNGHGHLIHTFGTQGRGSTLKEAFENLKGELNSLVRFYGRGYQFKETPCCESP